MFARICYYFPAYTLERVYRTPLAHLFSLDIQLASLIKNDSRRAV